MADVVVLKPTAASAISAERAASIPWYLWAGLLAATCAVVGGHWDISWHRSIGRDTFWTPAHLAIYMCGIIAGFSGGWVVLSNTFGPSAARAAATVRIWGFRAPLGAFMGIWGGVTMITSAPFDDWWHSAYGLDVKILSPPHVVLIIGLMTIQVGALIQVLGEMNRAGAPERKLRAAGARRRRVLEWMFLYGAGIMFIGMQTILMEYHFRANLHNSQFYRVVAAVAILMLAGPARASLSRWPATIIATIYSVALIGLILILPLFPAEPKLGPVFQQVTHFIPPDFPLLVLFPAIVLDLLLKRFAALNKWALAALCGAAFLAVFIAVQWPFADFLQSPAARNWFFGAHYLDYGDSPMSFTARYLFLPQEPAPVFLRGMGLALLFTVLAARLSLGWGDWMRKIQR